MPRRLLSRSDFERFRAYVAALYVAPEPSVFLGYLQDLHVPAPFRLRMKVLYSDSDPAEVLGALARSGRIEILNPEIPAYSLHVESPKKRPRFGRLPFALLPTEHRNVKVVLAISPHEQWAEFQRFARQRYPELVPIFLSQQDLITAALAFRDALPGYTLRVREISKKESIEFRSPRKARTIREWTDEDLRDVLAAVADRRQTITSMTLEFFRQIGEGVDVTPAALCKVTKRGEVVVTGKFQVAWDSVVVHVAQVGNEKLRSYSHRGLRDREYAPAPLQIAFRRPIFHELAEVKRFVELLSTYPQSMHSVLHGNPHAHVRISDILDGSSFDVWAVAGNKIAILPRLKASEGAIQRLIHYIFEQFREGLVTDFAPS